MKKIILTKEEYDYLINTLLKDKNIIIPKNNIIDEGDNIHLYLNENISDNIRELAEDEIGLHFDENYNPTKVGWILEHFIDKFYT